MIKTIKELVSDYVTSGYSIPQAKSIVSQQIILSKISKSPYLDKVLLKGGVVMFNITKEKRRSTIDLDFDFIRYDISDESIMLFIDCLNKYDSYYKVKLNGKIKESNQADYKGKRIHLIISDKSESLNFKIDIGVHTLLAINQNVMCFSYIDSTNISLLINPPEQIFAEKFYSLAKHGSTSTRFKDIDDMYYLLINNMIDANLVLKCLNSLMISGYIKDIDTVIDNISDCLTDSYFINNYTKNKYSWLDVDCKVSFKRIMDFVCELKKIRIKQH